MPTDSRNLKSAFVAVTTLFFAWGFITATLDTLDGPGLPLLRQRISC